VNLLFGFENGHFCIDTGDYYFTDYKISLFPDKKLSNSRLNLLILQISE